MKVILEVICTRKSLACCAFLEVYVARCQVHKSALQIARLHSDINNNVQDYGTICAVAPLALLRLPDYTLCCLLAACMLDAPLSFLDK